MNKSVGLSLAASTLAVLSWWVLSNPSERNGGDVVALAEAQERVTSRPGVSSLPEEADRVLREAEALQSTAVVTREGQRDVTGRLIDEAGVPMANAAVRVVQMVIDGGETNTTESLFTTDAVGLFSFDLTLDFKGGGFKLAFSHERPFGGALSSDLDVFTDPIEFPFVLGDVVMVATPVQAARTGTLVGSVVVPLGSLIPGFQVGIQPVDSVQWRGFSAKLFPDGFGSSDGAWWNSPVIRSGEFGWRGLPAGLYNVRLKMGFNGEELVGAWGNVRVLGGVKNRDPRLQAIPIPGVEDWVRVVLVDTAGKQVEEGMCFVDSELGEWGSSERLSRAGIVNTKGAKRIRVEGPGFLSKEVDVRWPETRAVLERAPEVTLVMSEEVILGDGWSLVAGLIPVGTAEQSWQRMFPDWKDFDGKQVRLSPTRLGRQLVRFAVRKGGLSMGVGSDTGLFIDVWPDDGGKSFPIDVSEEMLQELREREQPNAQHD